MIRKTLLAACGAGMLTVAALAAPTASGPAAKLKCTLTGKVVEKCCCAQRNGKTHCTLADKDVKKCCCKPAEEKTEGKQTR